MRAALGVLLLLACAPPAAPPLSTIEDGTRRVLKCRHGYETVSRLDGGRTGLYYDLGELAGELRPRARQVVLLGLGGGELLRAARRTLPGALLVGVDVDGEKVRVAREEFRIGDFGALGLEEEGMAYLRGRRDGSLDVLMVDVFDDDKIPPEFLAAPFFQLGAAKLSEHGLFMMNLYPAETLLEVTRALEAAHLRLVDLRESNGNAFVVAER